MGGMDLAFGVLSVYEGKPERVLEIQKYVNEQYECCSNKVYESSGNNRTNEWKQGGLYRGYVCLQ